MKLHAIPLFTQTNKQPPAHLYAGIVVSCSINYYNSNLYTLNTFL